MLELISILWGFLIFCFVVWGIRTSGWTFLAFSPVWGFMVATFLAYPVQALIIKYFNVELQSGEIANLGNFSLAIIIAFTYTMAVASGYMHSHRKLSYTFFSARMDSCEEKSNFGKSRTLWFAFFALGALFFYLSNSSYTVAHQINSWAQAKTKGGEFVVLMSFFTSFLYCYVAIRIKGLSNIHKSNIILVGLIAICLLLTYPLSSRRYLLDGIGLILIIYALGSNTFFSRKSKILLVMLPMLTVLFIPIAEIFRTAQISILGSFFSDFPQRVCSTFEGMNHLSRFLDIVNFREIFFGYDFGKAWGFETFLGLIPRSIWASKPIDSAYMIQHILYPSSVETAVMPATFPHGFVVDFIVGYGYGVGLILSFLLGVFFNRCFLAILNYNKVNSVVLMIAIFSLLNAFNFVRSGLSMVSVILVMILPVIIFHGIGNSLELINFYLLPFKYPKNKMQRHLC